MGIFGSRIVEDTFPPPPPPSNLVPFEAVAKKYPGHPALKDSEGFVQSFSMGQEEEYIQFFKEFGFVVINNILNQDDIEESIDEMWTEIESTPWGRDRELFANRNDPSTWENDTWPTGLHLGMLGKFEAIGKMAWKNRQNPLLYKAFSTILQEEKLWVSVDRWGIMRPTVGVDMGGSTGSVDKPEWKSYKSWLHWDLNPWIWLSGGGQEYEYSNFISENNGSKNDGLPKLQGLICLSESREEDGCFCAVPGFNQNLKEWTENSKDTIESYKNSNQASFTYVPKQDPMLNQVQKISARAGSLIIWSSELPHCNFPNNSNRFRMNQYIKMFPAQPRGKNVKERTKDMKSFVPKEAEITPLGEKLLGLKNW
eukprot:TRINITY_DN7301_c0_g1_i1.p1 TRINITY_DN7301_c0_g1~~TRINITY_DN7301_c0_g1_i1.p1  ORF type:complete len:368 (+),score=69.89 TRINITY_DN7301_c0_g1_i1:75-1178(+)